MQLHLSWQRTAVALVLLAAALPLAARALAGPPGAVVHVRWQSSLDDSAREDLEARFRLADGERIEGTTWRYDLVDPSSDNIRPLVDHPAVADTHDVNRPRGALEPSAARTTRRLRFERGSAIVTAADALAVVAVGLASAMLLLAGRLSRIWAAATRVAGAAATTPLARWLSRGIPDIDARTAAVFRIVFGLAVLWLFASRPVDAARLDGMFTVNVAGELHDAVLQWLRGHPAAVNLLTPWLTITGVAFTAGLLTRVSYALFVAGALVWAFGAVAFDNTHPYSTLMLSLVALLPSRWGDAWSIDAWLRSKRQEEHEHASSKRYGYTVWVTGLVFGVAFAAAAWAKLAPNGISWILNGSVKYHFIADAANARVDWGLQLAANPLLAIVASLAAVVIEALVITAAFRKSEAYRLAMGAGAMSLLVGFHLFMGLFWPGWWILLLGFLPWATMNRGCVRWCAGAPVRWCAGAQAGTSEGARVPLASARIALAQLALIVFVIAQQLVVSGLAVERAPMFSNYPMYSETFDSPEAFNAATRPVHRIVVATDEGRVALSCNASGDLVEDFRTALKGSAQASANVWRAVRACRPDLAAARQVSFYEERRAFDWQRLTFTSPPPLVLGTLKGQ
jgi:hypothetical protein